MNGNLSFPFLRDSEVNDLNFLISISSRFIKELNMKVTKVIDDHWTFTYIDPNNDESEIKMTYYSVDEEILLDLDYIYDMDMFFKVIKIIAEETETGLDYYSDKTDNSDYHDEVNSDELASNEAAIDIDSEELI